MTEQQTKVITTIGKVGGLLTMAAGYENLIPDKYKWIGLVITLLSSTVKDLLMFFQNLWSTDSSNTNKTVTKTLLVLAIASLAISPIACKTNQLTTSATVEQVTITSVNTAMQVWHDWVVAGNATQNQLDSVKLAYESYYTAQQSASAALHLMVNSANTNGPTAADIASAQQSVSSAENALVSIITTYTTKK